jgi:hypothetical protein
MATPPPASPSIFQSLFGGGAIAATDTKKATDDIASINAQFTGMSSTLTSSMSMATSLAPELKDVVDTSALTSSLDSIKNLQSACKEGMSPEECATKQAQLQADTDAAQLKFFNDTLLAQTQLLIKQRDKIQNQYDTIKGEKTESLKKGALVFKGEPVLEKYEKLLAKINADILKLNNSKPYVVPTNSKQGVATSSTSTSTPVIAPYELPSVTAAGEYDLELERLIYEYDTLIGNPYDLNRVSRNTKTFFYRYLIPILFYTVLGLSILWGGIVCANMYVDSEKDFLFARIWYFIHGMIGFPGVILYSIVKPPFWVSGIFPWRALVKEDLISEAPVPEETANTGENAENATNTGENAENATNTAENAIEE